LRVSYPDLEAVTATFENIEPELKQRKWIDWNKLRLNEIGSSFRLLPLPSLKSLSKNQPSAATDSPASISGGERR